MKYKSVKKPEKCPECGSDKIAYILYGLPNYSLSL
jgi:predicted Zn-ribbon and HTH transcriptional regulator